jgi:amidase
VTPEDILYAGLAGQAELIRAKQLSSVELTALALERIHALDAGLGAFRTVLRASALREAAARDAQDIGERGPLHGVPVAIKDENDVAGEVTTYGGLAQRTPVDDDSETVRRLRAAGAVIVGKTRMSEFGQWPYTESVAFGITRNPWDPGLTPGGSSGGSAVAVATGMVAAALGGDGGGSIRIPAAWCGLFGLKPQRGRVSAAPYPSLWGALGTTGPLTRKVVDSALFYDVIHGATAQDRWHAIEPVVSYVDQLREPVPSLRIGIIEKPAVPGIPLDPDQRVALTRTAELLEEFGHRIEQVRRRLPNHGPSFVPQYFGAVRDEARLMEDPARLERRTRKSIRLGKLFPDATVRWAERRGDALAKKADRLLYDYDLLLTPTVPSLPPAAGILDGIGPVRALWRSNPATAYTAIWNVTGHPAAAVPAGFTPAGLPLSIQLIGPRDGEGLILKVAAQLEAARPWANRRPRSPE